MATIIAAHDLSGIGRCSLTTALAVIPALGHTCYPLPTAVLSRQTGLSGHSFLNLTKQMPQYLKDWQSLKIMPDMIYTGFLGDGAQASLLSGFIEEHPKATVLVDPVMGDGGKLYPCFDEAFVKDMKTLAATAHILVPNTTEFNLLSGRNPAALLPSTVDEVLSAALSIDAPRLKYVIITSAVFCGKTCNLLVDIQANTVVPVLCRNNGISYSGSGDLFASIIFGLAASGVDMKAAVKAAGDFLADVIAAMPKAADPRYGVQYEPFLGALLRHSTSYQRSTVNE